MRLQVGAVFDREFELAFPAPALLEAARLLREARRELLEHALRKGQLLRGGGVAFHQRLQRGGTGCQYFGSASGSRGSGLGAAQFGLQPEHLRIVGADLLGPGGRLTQCRGRRGAGEGPQQADREAAREQRGS